MSKVAFWPWRAAALERSARIERMVWPLRPMIRPMSLCLICRRKTVVRPRGISESMASSGNSTSCRIMNSRNCRTNRSLARPRELCNQQSWDPSREVPDWRFPHAGCRVRCPQGSDTHTAASRLGLISSHDRPEGRPAPMSHPTRGQADSNANDRAGAPRAGARDRMPFPYC